MEAYIGEIIVGALALIGTLGGSWMAHRKSSALIAYRLEQLEQKVNKHNQVIERTYLLEQKEAVLEEKIEHLEHFHQ